MDKLFEKAKAGGIRRMVVVAANDIEVLESVIDARRDKVIIPILIGDADGINEKLKELGEALDGYEIIDQKDDVLASKLGVTLIKDGKADFLMKGFLNTSTLLREVVNKETGINTGGVISHVVIAQLPSYDKILIFTDVGIMIEPNLEQKKGIIQNAVDILRSLGYDKPKVAVLSATENVNPKIQDSVDAAALTEMSKTEELKNCIVEGPISFDIALDAEIAKHKGYVSQVAGEPDILLVPNMTAGNILIKALIRFVPEMKSVAFATGAGTPIVVTSRGSSAKTKYNSILAAAAVSTKK